MKSLFIGVYSEGLSYADRSIQENGDYKKVAFLSYRTLELTIYAPKSPLLPAILHDAARMQARRGQEYEISSSGQAVVLGGRACS